MNKFIFLSQGQKDIPAIYSNGAVRELKPFEIVEVIGEPEIVTEQEYSDTIETITYQMEYRRVRTQDGFEGKVAFWLAELDFNGIGFQQLTLEDYYSIN